MKAAYTITARRTGQPAEAFTHRGRATLDAYVTQLMALGYYIVSIEKH